MKHSLYFYLKACQVNQTSIGGLCCGADQVNDNGVCASKCSNERPAEISGVCECATDKVDLGNGLCCNLDQVDVDIPCAQEIQRNETVLELCSVNDSSGLCRPISDCTTVLSPEKGTCSDKSHVCCFFEAPVGINNETVAAFVAMTEVRLLCNKFAQI